MLSVEKLRIGGHLELRNLIERFMYCVMPHVGHVMNYDQVLERSILDLQAKR